MADLSLFFFYMMDHIVFFGRVKLITDMRLKLIAGFLCDWFWLFEIIFGVSATLIENAVLRHNLSKIKKQEVNFIVVADDPEPGAPAERNRQDQCADKREQPGHPQEPAGLPGSRA